MTNPAAKLANITTVHILQAPTGVWYLAGTYPAELGCVRVDGAPFTAADAKACAQVGPRIAGCRTRTYATREIAVAALREYGWQGE